MYNNAEIPLFCFHALGFFHYPQNVNLWVLTNQILFLIRFYRYIIQDTARAYQSLQVFRLGSVILLSIVLVKSGFESDSIGDFEWFIFLSNVASFFWGLGLKNAFMSFFPSIENKKGRKLIFNLAIFFLFLGVVAFGVLYMLNFPRLESLYTYLPWLFCFLVLGTAASLSEHILIVKQRSFELFYYGFISYSVYLFGLSVLSFITLSIEWLFVGLAIWAILRFIYFLSLLWKYSDFKLDMSLIAKFILFGLPLVMHVLLGGGMEYVDGYLVNHFYERSDFTYFRYGARELPFNTIFISAMASAFIPLAVANLKDSLADIKKRTERLMNFLFPISMILMLVSPLIFTFVYSEEYLVSAFIFNIYLLILCSRILLPQIVIYAKHKNSFLMKVSVVEFLINIGLSLLLMQKFGLYGIAFATVIAFFVQKILLIIFTGRVLKVKLKEYLNIPKYLIFTVILYVTFFLSIILY